MTRKRKSTRVLSGKRLLLLGLAVLAGGSAVFAANRVQVRRNAAKMHDAARKAAADGNATDALRLYTEYLNFQPTDVAAVAEYVGVLESTADGSKKSLRDRADGYERLLRTDPTRTADRRKLMTLYFDNTHYTGAKDHAAALLDPARGGVPDDAEVLALLATCELRTGRPKEAVERLRQAVATNRAPSEAYTRLAALLRSTTATKEAAEEADGVLRKLTADRPNDVAARLARARYLIDQKSTADAERELELARTELPAAAGDADLILTLADLKLKNDKPAEARDVLQRAVAVNDKEPRLRFLLAEVLAELDQLEPAKDQLQKATALLPSDGPLVLDAADRKFDLGMIREAKADAARFDGKPQYRPVVDYLGARVALAEGNWPAALAAARAALPPFESMPRYFAKAQVVIGLCMKQAGNPDAMFAAFTAALKADPLLSAAEFGLAEANAALGRWTAAAPVFQRFAGRYPEARAALARRAFAVQVNTPAAKRDWADFDRLCGAAPFPTELLLLQAESRVVRGDPAAAMKLLDDALTAKPDDVAVIAARALARGADDAAAGIAALDAAAQRTGEKPEFLIARGRMLARRTPIDVPAIQALGANAAAYTPREKFVLYSGLGELLARVPGGQPAALDFYRKAGAEEPFHLPTRSAVLELAFQNGTPADVTAALDDVKRLEGADGPTVRLAEVRRDAKAIAADPARLAAARAKIAAVVKARESWGWAHAVLGELDESAGDSDNALDRYRRAFELGERSDTLTRRYVKLLFDRNKFDEARRVLTLSEAARALPDDLRKRLVLVDSLLTRNPDKSAAAVKAAENSTDAGDHLFRGQALLLGGDRAAAAVAFEKAVTLDPAKADGWVNLVRAYSLIGNRPAAVKAAERAEAALAGKPTANPAGIPTVVGIMKELAGDAVAAEAQYRKALTAVPADPTATRYLVGLLDRAGRAAEAKVPLNALIASTAAEPARAWARRTLADVLTGGPGGHRNVNEAAALLDANLATARRPEDLRAKAFVLGRDPFRATEARTLLETTAAMGPFTAAELVRRAEWSAAAGRLSAAEDDLREATSGSPLPSSDHFAALFRVQFAQNRFPQARETLAKWQKAGPPTAELRVAEAKLLVKEGKPAEAKALVGDDPARLVEAGLTDDAERVLAADPARRGAYAMFLVGVGKPAKAVETARAADLPVKAAAQIFTAAVATRPRAGVPPAELPAWDATLNDLAAWLRTKRAADPGAKELHTAEAVVADAQGRFDDAIRGYETVLAADPNSAMAANNLGLLLALHRPDDAKRAADTLDRAVETHGPRPFLLDSRAVARLALGRAEEAIRDLEAALVQDQKAVYFFHLALAFEKAGNVARKIAAIDAATTAGLTRAMVHAKEYPEYVRLFGPGS